MATRLNWRRSHWAPRKFGRCFFSWRRRHPTLYTGEPQTALHCMAKPKPILRSKIVRSLAWLRTLHSVASTLIFLRMTIRIWYMEQERNSNVYRTVVWRFQPKWEQFKYYTDTDTNKLTTWGLFSNDAWKYKLIFISISILKSFCKFNFRFH